MTASRLVGFCSCATGSDSVCVQIGSVLQQRYAGQAANLVKEAGGSANTLVGLVLDSFLGFRDTAIYR